MGIGDNIMLTAKARRLKKENPDKDILVGKNIGIKKAERKQWIITDKRKDYNKEIRPPWMQRWSLIYDNNPNITKLDAVKDLDNVIWIPIQPRPYIVETIKDRTNLNSLGKPLKIRHVFKEHSPKPGDIFLTEDEKNFALQNIPNKPFVYIEPNIKEKGNILKHGDNKDWGYHKWQEVVNILKEEVTFVQCDYRDRFLDNVQKIITPNFRYAAAVLKKSMFYVGHEGGMHHAAAAFNMPAVVIFGGFTAPWLTGYDFHTNLYYDHPDTPCGRLQPCEHCADAMESITVGHIVAEIEKMLKTV